MILKNQRIKYLILLSFVLCLVSYQSFAQNLGDVNNSDSVDIVDALLVAQFYVGLNPVGFIQSVGDVDCSESINIVDALLVVQFYVGLISKLPCSSSIEPPE